MQISTKAMLERGRDLAEKLGPLQHAQDVEARRTSQRLLELLEQAGHGAFARNYFSPGHITASAAVLHPVEMSLGLIWHRKLSKWLQPGGHVDAGDKTVLAAALREVEEETGLEVQAIRSGPIHVDIHAIPALKNEPEHWHFDCRFLFRAQKEEPTLAADEVADFCWQPINRLNELDTDASVVALGQAIKRLGNLSQ